MTDQPSRMLRVLLFSTLFPSSTRPNHGVFVETRLRELRKTGAVEAQVVAPVPWFPSTDPRHGDKARMAATPAFEARDGVPVWHPRYPLVPKFGMTAAPLGLALAALPTLRRLQAEGFDFDLIDAHYFYPDGVAAALLAKWLDKALVITARGSDITLISRHALPRRMMRWAAGRAGRLIGVSQDLVERMAALGMDRDRLQVVRNGVDVQRFHPIDRDEARQRLGLSGQPLLLSVGNLVSNKGHDKVIDALALLRKHHPGAALVVVGSGPEQAALERHAQACGLADAVRLVGPVPNTALYTWYSAADALVLASEREGWPNVLLEALASGTPVVATRVGGVPEILAGCPGSQVVDAGDGASLAGALRPLIAQPPSRQSLRAHAERFGWQQTSEAQYRIFNQLAAAPSAPAPVA